MSTLYICATPIGNLDDISKRLIETLETVDVIYAEDTRRGKKLLSHLDIKKPISSYFIGNETSKVNEILNEINQGKSIALISDAGTPLISDPGEHLIKELIKNDVEIISIPGPSSVLVALTLSGFDTDKFKFSGFIPKSGKEREEFFYHIKNSQETSICFTSPKRIKKDLNEFVNMGLDNQIVICRELTKKFETIYRGDATSLLSKINDSDLKGEITLVISKSTKVIDFDIDIQKAVESMISFNIPKREIAKILSTLTNQTTNEIYDKIKDF